MFYLLIHELTFTHLYNFRIQLISVTSLFCCCFSKGLVKYVGHKVTNRQKRCFVLVNTLTPFGNWWIQLLLYCPTDKWLMCSSNMFVQFKYVKRSWASVIPKKKWVHSGLLVQEMYDHMCDALICLSVALRQKRSTVGCKISISSPSMSTLAFQQLVLALSHGWQFIIAREIPLDLSNSNSKIRTFLITRAFLIVCSW